ncbi:hypothetical protein GCM10007067_01940 [Lysobacter bugurensis]|uniref:Uncharacterized protein n=1 Tax=Cognatilysobacter bugurensis TaxID=543356 RepID=A0A918SVH5_9GAMM|nr:hypothetical protein GCM10007067_01940 [Lysobacter bugurensis]
MFAVPLLEKNRPQVYIAPTSVITSSSPVLLTVPLSVIAPASRRTTAPLPRSRKVESFKAGLPLRMGSPEIRLVEAASIPLQMLPAPD